MRKSPKKAIKGRMKHSSEVAALVAATRALLEHPMPAHGLPGKIIGDVVSRFDPDLRRLFVSSASDGSHAAFPAELGKTNRESGLPGRTCATWDAALRRAFATGLPAQLRQSWTSTEGGGLRHFDCRILPERDDDGKICSVLSVSRDVTDLRLAYDAERRSSSIDEALHEATLALNRSLDREKVLTTLLDGLRRMMPFDRASVMLLEEATRVSVRAVYDGSRAFPLTPDLRTEFDPAEHPILSRILKTGAPVLIPDVRCHPEWSLQFDPQGEASWMGVPLFAGGDVAGLFALSKREAGYFNQNHVRLAEAMSAQASVAVENAILFEQMKVSRPPHAGAFAAAGRGPGERTPAHRPRAARRSRPGAGFAALRTAPARTRARRRRGW